MPPVVSHHMEGDGPRFKEANIILLTLLFFSFLHTDVPADRGVRAHAGAVLFALHARAAIRSWTAAKECQKRVKRGFFVLLR